MNIPKLYYSKPGEISPDGCWIITHSYYLYTHDTLLGVIWTFLTEYKNDWHIVG